MSKSDLFLKRVKVKEFTDSTKIGLERRLAKFPNENKDDVYTVIGVTSINEGHTEFDESPYFVMTGRHQVYLVARSIGRRFKVLAKDLEVIDNV